MPVFTGQIEEERPKSLSLEKEWIFREIGNESEKTYHRKQRWTSRRVALELPGGLVVMDPMLSLLWCAFSPRNLCMAWAWPKKMGRGEKTSLDSSVCHCRACILNRGDTVPKGAKIDSCQGWQGGRVGVCSKKLRCYMVYGFLKGHST